MSNTIFFDKEGAARDIAHAPWPFYFLDFETIQFAVPIWAGTRPYQQIPFQFSLHSFTPESDLVHDEFLDISGGDPSRYFAEQLIKCMGEIGAVFVYSAAFEKNRIRELAERFSDLEPRLLAINERVIDLLPIARNRYYHPSQQGSWSIKKVLPAAVPELRYDALEWVQDGGMAMEAYLEAIHPATHIDRKVENIASGLASYEGYAILLTNDSAYWRPRAKAGTIDEAFNLTEGRTLRNSMAWTEKASDGTKKNREKDLQLIGEYKLNWQDFSITTSGSYGQFRYIAVHIPKFR